MSQALDYDNACEKAYSLSMQVYQRINDRSSIIRMYQAYLEALQRLGLPSSPDMEQLYRRLVS